MSKFTPCVGALLLAACLNHARAEDAKPLDPVVVTATRTEQPATAALAPVVVLDRRDIERSLAADLGELLRFVAGLDVARNGGPGQTTSLFLRGTESNHVLVLVDGVEINPGTIGGASIQNIPLESIERVELVKGPRSALYGSEAIGGVINIITRRAAGGRLEAGAGAGRYGARDATLGLGWRGESFEASLDLGHRELDGFRIQDSSTLERGNDRDSVNAQLGWRNDTRELRVRHLQSTGTTEYLDFGGAPVAQDFATRVSALEGATDLGERWRTRLTLSRAIDEIVQRQPNAFTGATDFLETVRDAVEWQNDLSLGAHLVTLGAHWSDEDADVESFGRFGATTRIAALYAQDQWTRGAHALIAAFRATDHESFGRHDSWNLDYGYALSPRVRLAAGIGAGFRAPDATDLYSPCCGNAALEPERARNAELGLRWTPRAADRVTASAYYDRIDDLISFGPSFVLENIDRAQIRGLELGWTHVNDGWHTRLAATLQDTEDVATGERLPRRADRSLSASVVRAFGRHELGMDVFAAGDRKDSGFSSTVNGGYALVNLTARFALGTQWSLRAQVENLFDKTYQTAASYNEPGRGLSVRLDWRSE